MSRLTRQLCDPKMRSRRLQVAENETEMGPGLQEAVRTFRNTMEKLPTMPIRSPTMYALANPALVGSLV